MSGCDVVSGFLDVKISARTRRGLTPWKAWQKQWCEIRKLDNIHDGVELKLKSACDGALLNCVALPRSSTICRTESRTKQYAFGVFTPGLGRSQKKPLLFMSGNSESDSQAWVAAMRRMLCVASYLPVGESNFHVSLVDNNHSRAAGLMGLHGVLGTTTQEIVISDPCTGDPKISWKWYQFHQFHLQATSQPSDEKVICVMHTSGEFPSGPGQLYIYCRQAPRLLNFLVARGKRLKNLATISTSERAQLMHSRRLSRSEGDLCCEAYARYGSVYMPSAPDSPLYVRSSEVSDDSGVRVSLNSDNSDDFELKSKVGASVISIGMAMLTKTPGGSETNGDSLLDLTISDLELPAPRRESGISMASGIYEEIPDEPPVNGTSLHVYENPIDIILRSDRKAFKPPPLPPRFNETLMNETYTSMLTPYKPRCNTLPAKDLQRISQIFTGGDSQIESDYTLMMSPKRQTTESPKNSAQEIDPTYLPMSPAKTKLREVVENCYMVMSGSNKKN